ncbi:hypothetical protein HNR73_006290 [Phytomonospora endophytica]|uniref:Uncharacterized protein n=1 Tax=Phytomonospora endophytica TaxID=714109 RepID=A0A841FYI0_9ACTN|nr:hypothetical protein [Phytomonospora endophytica]
MRPRRARTHGRKWNDDDGGLTRGRTASAMRGLGCRGSLRVRRQGSASVAAARFGCGGRLRVRRQASGAASASGAAAGFGFGCGFGFSFGFSFSFSFGFGCGGRLRLQLRLRVRLRRHGGAAPDVASTLAGSEVRSPPTAGGTPRSCTPTCARPSASRARLCDEGPGPSRWRRRRWSGVSGRSGRGPACETFSQHRTASVPRRRLVGDMAGASHPRARHRTTGRGRRHGGVSGRSGWN